MRHDLENEPKAVAAPTVKVEWTYHPPEVDMKAHSMVMPKPKIKCEWQYYRHKPHRKD